MNQEELARELHVRAVDQGRHEPLAFYEVMARTIFRYDIDLTLDCFKNLRGVVLQDARNRSVGLYQVISMGGTIRSAVPVYTDVVVLVEDSVILGWVLARDVAEVNESSFVVSSKTVNRMPKDFDFAQDCPHMSVHGGIWSDTDSGWSCFGCGKLLAGI